MWDTGTACARPGASALKQKGLFFAPEGMGFQLVRWRERLGGQQGLCMALCPCCCHQLSEFITNLKMSSPVKYLICNAQKSCYEFKFFVHTRNSSCYDFNRYYHSTFQKLILDAFKGVPALCNCSSLASKMRRLCDSRPSIIKLMTYSIFSQ